MNKTPILGICGVAKAGKDTFFEVTQELGVQCQRLAFADALKAECNEFLLENIKISSFTTNPKEKKIIRPFLVAYGTHLRRKLDPNCWIKSIKEQAENLILKDALPIITDVRYENEARWIHELGGKLIHISRKLPSVVDTLCLLPPANTEEAIENPKLKEAADEIVEWETFPEDLISKCKPIVKKCLANFQITN